MKGNEDRSSYIVFETATDWDGNNIAIIGRFQVGDTVIVSRECREKIRKDHPEIAAKLAGIQKIVSVHHELNMLTPPRYWTGGLARYCLSGYNSFLISDADLKLATDKDRTTELIQRINAILLDMFPSYMVEIGMTIRDDVVQDVKENSEWPRCQDSDITMAIQRVLLKKMGVSV